MEKSSTYQAEGDSPSMTLLMRLQQLRQWQEKQRVNLEKSNSFQNSSSINSSFESSISEPQSNIPTTSGSYAVVSYSSCRESSSLASKKKIPSHLGQPLSYSTDSKKDTQVSCYVGLNKLGTDTSDSSNSQTNSQVFANTQDRDSESVLIEQREEQELDFVESEAQIINNGDKDKEYTSENYDATTYLSLSSSDLYKKGPSLPLKSPKIVRKLSTSESSFDKENLSNTISLKTIGIESPCADADANSPRIICKNSETLFISEYQDSENAQDHGISEDQNTLSIKVGCNENDNRSMKNFKIHDSFDDIPIRTQSKNFQDVLSKNLEGNMFFDTKNSPTVPKFSFIKKSVGSAATQVVDKDSGFGSSSTISTNSTKIEKNTKNKVKRTFLRKGEGTSRFGMRPSRLKKQNLNTTSCKSAPKVLEYDKLMNINKDNLVLENIRTKDNSSIDKGMNQPIKNTANVQLNEIPNTQYTKNSMPIYSKSLEGNSNNPINKKEKQEVEELSAFERLEELADETSFCSNSSTVISLLQKGLRSASSTPIRSPAPFDFGESPIQVNNKKNSESHQKQKLLSLSEVLDHCAALVQLEKKGNSNITQKDIDYLVESIMSDQTVSQNSLSEYLQNLQRGTINLGLLNNSDVPLIDDQKPRVHFRQQGVDVHEYDVFDSESDTTLTDVQSIDEDVTDLVTTSDLEALAHLNLHGMLEHVPDKNDVLKHNQEEMVDKSSVHLNKNLNLNNYLFQTEGLQKNSLKNLPKKADSVQKVLEFSPPRRPPNSASHLVWSIFGQEKENKKSHQNKISNLKAITHNEEELTKDSPKTCDVDHEMRQDSDKLEIDSHKTLLMAKICELEKETKTFQKKNHELQLLQNSLKLEQENLSKEKDDFKKKMAEHESKLREAINRERNRLWKEKQDLKQLNKEQNTLEAARAQSLEIIMLKEKLSDVEEEMKKKECSHQFSVRKLKDKVKSLEQENEKLKVDLCTLQTLEKENSNLKHKLNRKKLENKTVLSDTAINQTQNLKKKVTIANTIKKSVEIKQKPKSINDINKELDKELKINEEIDISIKDVYPSRNLNIKDIEKATLSTTSKNKFAIKDVKEVASFKGHKNELENKPEKSSSAVMDGDKSSEDILSFSSPSTLINQETKVTEGEVFVENREMSSEIFRNVKKYVHPPGSGNIDFTENCRNDGTKEIIYANGNKKEIFPNGVIVMSYYNGDCKEQHQDKTIYIYGTDQTKHITFTDGKEIVEFPNGQKETTYPDGSSEITFPDKSVKKISNDGTEICVMKDGTVVRTNLNGSKVFEFPGGQREIHTSDEKRREYPDGTIKILYDDGRVETRYKNGRIRIRDKQRNILTDTHG